MDVHTINSDTAQSTGSNYISKEEGLLRKEKKREGVDGPYGGEDQ